MVDSGNGEIQSSTWNNNHSILCHLAAGHAGCRPLSVSWVWDHLAGSGKLIVDTNTIKLFGSKATDNWQTPAEMYQALDNEFHFDFDPCPLHSTFDGLSVPWGKRCFVNPPYSNVRGFLQKALYEIEKGNTEIAVFLTFANTDTGWFHDYIYGKAEIRFIRGRIRFLTEHGKVANSAMRPSMLAIFRSDLPTIVSNM